MLDLIERYGLAAVFLNLLLEQIGLPLPAYPILMLTGALSVEGGYAWPSLLAVAVLACVIADCGWYWAGRRYGGRVLRTLCRISLSPDSCVRQTESIYSRWGAKSLMLAKFVPGFATMATTLAGNARISFRTFLFFDIIGATLYAGAGLLLGIVFHNAVNDVIDVLADLGRIGLFVLVVAFALFVLYKWWQRQRLLNALKMARISVDELGRMIDAGERPAILDVRSEASRERDGIIPGAIAWSIGDSDGAQAQPALALTVARDSEVVVYCACPNEASAARVAKALMKAGFTRVRPLQGGIDAWAAAGYRVVRVEPVTTPVEASPHVHAGI